MLCDLAQGFLVSEAVLRACFLGLSGDLDEMIPEKCLVQRLAQSDWL